MSRITRFLVAVMTVGLLCTGLLTAPVPPAQAASQAQAVDLGAAVRQRLAVATGASGTIIEVRIRRVSASVLVVTVRPGQVFRNSQAARQDVVAQKVAGELTGPGSSSGRATSVMALNDRATHYFLVQAFCLQFHKDNLGAGLAMSVAGIASPRVVAVLRAIRGESLIVAQDGIWAVTDNVTKQDVASRGYGLAATGIQQVRALLVRAGLDPKQFKLTA